MCDLFYPHIIKILEIQYNDHIIFEMIEMPFQVRNFISYVKINKLNKHKHTQIIPSIFQCFLVLISYYNINYKDMHNTHIT